MKETIKGAVGVIIAAVILGVSMLAQFYAPAPWNKYGGIVVMTLTASLIVARAIQVITANKARLTFLPYVIVTFLVLASMIVFASGLVQLVAGIVFGALVGFAGLYWITALMVHEFNRLVSPKS
jgi:hypothetical protein